jgi:hypothetical protein
MATEYADNPPQYFKPNIPNNSPDVAGYSVTVTDDGATNIFRKNKNNTLQAVGKIAKGGGFSAVPLGQFSNQATQAEINYFTANARKTVTDQAVPVVRRGIGGSAGGGNAKINQILGTNLSSQSTNPDQQGGTAPPATGSPDAQGGSTPTSPQQPSQQTSGATLVYPNDLASTNQDRIMFHAHEYKSGGRLGGTIFDFELNPIQYIPLNQRVYLPVQASISDQNSVGWEPDTLNPIEIAAAKYSNNLITSATKDIGTVAAGGVGGALNLIKNDPRLQESIKNYIIGQAIGVNNLQSRLQGQVLNPNLELLFQGPQLRPFNFSFKLSPRSEDEAKTVKSIINYFKKNMSAKKTSDNIFLKAPNVFKIEYQHKNTKHPGINNIKMCALTNCSVDYTPLGTYMTYPEGTMVSYTISLQFQELTPIYDEDYKDPSQIEF